MGKVLKILHVIPNLSKGGAERLVLDICSELSKREDVQVKLITFSDLNLYRLESRKIDWSVIPVEVNLSILKRNQIDVKELQTAISSFAPDVIHTHLFYAELVTRLCSFPKARWFSHCHDNMIQLLKPKKNIKEIKNNLVHRYERKELFQGYKKNGGTTFVAISKDCERYFNINGGSYPVVFFPNAIKYLRFFQELGKDLPGSLKLINVGSMVDKKNQIFLLEIARQLKKQGVDFELNILGDGPNFKILQDSIQEYQLADCVKMHGNVDNVEQYLQEASVYVHSALYEPFGLVLLEAMSSGLPVVSLAAGGNNDIVKDNINGYLLKHNCSVKDFTDVVVNLWNDKEKYSSLAKNAQAYAKGYDIESYVDRLLNLYKA